MNLNLETLLPWSEPKWVQTRAGERLLRKAAPNEAFSAAWREGKEALKAAGISWSKDDRTGQWEVCWWQLPNPEEQAARIAAQKSKQEAERRAHEEAISGKPAALPDECETRLAAIEARCLPYQVASVRRQVRALLDYESALDASDTGTGKTFVSLAACATLGAKPFIICPKAVIPSWKRAAEHFGMEIVGVCNYELLRMGSTPVVKRIEVEDKRGKSHEQFEWQLPKDTVLVFDECHRLKDPKTLNNALGLAALRQSYRVLALSATCADNPMQMKFSGLVARLFEHEKRFFPWMMGNGVSRGRFGMEFNGGRDVLNRIHQQIFPLHGTRIRIADLGDQFPETQISAEAYELNGAAEEIQRVYDEMAAEIARIEMSELEDKSACILVEILRARQRAEVLKVPAIAAMVEDAVEEGLSVAVFVNFDASIDALASKLKTRCLIRGGQADADRQSNIDEFNADREHVILCNIKAGGVGVSLHGSPASRMRLAIICPTFSGQDLKQALGRCWRAKGAKSIQRIFFAAGTIEEQVCKQVREKIARIDALNDGALDSALRFEFEPVDETIKVQPTSVGIKTPEPRKRDALDALAERLTPEDVAQAHSAMKRLASCDHYHAPELLQISNGDAGRVRLAVRAAVNRHRMEVERGFAVLAEHGIGGAL